MDDPQSPTEAIRSLLFRKARTINERLLMRLQDAAGHLSRNENCAVIGALAGMEADIKACASSWCSCAITSRPRTPRRSYDR
jgi:hypothetical protein